MAVVLAVAVAVVLAVAAAVVLAVAAAVVLVVAASNTRTSFNFDQVPCEVRLHRGLLFLIIILQALRAARGSPPIAADPCPHFAKR
jgi:hypothetical protein